MFQKGVCVYGIVWNEEKWLRDCEMIATKVGLWGKVDYNGV